MRTEKGKQAFIVSGTKLWNEIPDSVKRSQTIESFNQPTYLPTYLKMAMQSFCVLKMEFWRMAVHRDFRVKNGLFLGGNGREKKLWG